MSDNVVLATVLLIAFYVAVKAVRAYMCWSFPPRGVPPPDVAPDSYGIGAALVFFVAFGWTVAVCYSLIAAVYLLAMWFVLWHSHP